MRFRLLQARLPDDPVKNEERAAFAARLCLPLDQVLAYDLLQGDTSLQRVTEGVDAVLVGGSGAFSVYDPDPWLTSFIDTLGALADAGFPTFASCFGFQGLVMALGGEVRRDEEGAEVGTFDLELTEHGAADPLFGSLPRQFRAQQGHKDRAFTWPSGVVNLAASPRCPYQALRIEGKPVYATQFHPELTATDNRLRFERYLAMYQAAFGASQANRMLDAFFDSTPCNGLLGEFARRLREGRLPGLSGPRPPSD